MSESRSPLQDEYLTSLRDKNARVAVFLVNGIKLVGRIQSFDTYVVMLENSGTQLVFKHAISTVIPQEGVATEERARQPRSAVEGAPRPRVASVK